MSDSATPNLWADLGLEDEWVELCPVCRDEDTQIPPCAWCDGLHYVRHECPSVQVESTEL